MACAIIYKTIQFYPEFMQMLPVHPGTMCKNSEYGVAPVVCKEKEIKL